MFEIGQQVVCIEDIWCFCADPRLPAREGMTLPICGRVYTIRDIIAHSEMPEGTVAFLFEEFVNQPIATLLQGVTEPCFLSSQFRPVKKTSIEVFEKMLVPCVVTS